MLFEPYKLRDLTLRNRIVVSPMCEYSSEDGFANDWHLVHLGSRAVGGASVVFTEAAAVEPRGRISPQDLGIYKDEHIEMLSRITKFIKGQGAIPAMQIAHAGRKASTRRPWEQPAGVIKPEEGGWTTVGPTTAQFASNYPVPIALDEAGIAAITQDFVAAAKRALAAGFELIELHFAHGYLAHEFYSPLSNTRTDKYGGSLENRIRFALETTEAVRKVWPERLPLFARISSTDWVEGGWDITHSVELAKQLKARGVDLIDCSSGGNVADAKIPAVPLYQVPFAEQIRRDAKVPTAAVGLITTPEECERILNHGQADLIVMAREFLRDPYFPMYAAAELDFDLPWPKQYERAKLARAAKRISA
ncbi:MAG TPA: NADH:flavin oxidoreductase/NADH oxidase [Candidatus Baltobacteraceae bacterium]|jgi:2,4-dienoyl-CoA reductase-like NADH-dependent reductase (Old Yellow Enzyme family)